MKMKKIWEWLDGKKTIIASVLIFCAGGAKALGWIDEGSFQTIITIAGAIAVYGIRDAIRKLE
jgi:hypothetical protein